MTGEDRLSDIKRCRHRRVLTQGPAGQFCAECGERIVFIGTAEWDELVVAHDHLAGAVEALQQIARGPVNDIVDGIILRDKASAWLKANGHHPTGRQ